MAEGTILLRKQMGFKDFCFLIVVLLHWFLDWFLIDFGTHLGSKIDPKSIKNRSKNQSKNWYNFWSILEPTWLHFGEVLGAKLGPSWHQNRSKKLSKNQSNVASILFRFFIDFGAQHAPKPPHMAQFWLQIGSQEGVTNVWTWQHFELLGDLGPKMGQDGPKTPPRRPKGPILMDFGLQLGGFWDPTWWFLEPILVDFGTG